MPNIEQRGKRSWRLTVEGGYDGSGNREQIRKTIRIDDDELLKPTKTANVRLQDYLRLELAKFQVEVESGQYVKPERLTFTDFVPKWKANYANAHLGEYTRLNYMRTINHYLIPEFGHVQMQKIKTMHLVAFFTRLRSPEARQDGQDKPLATNTLLNVYKALKSILDAACKWQIIAANPMDGVDRPRPSKTEKRALRATKRAYTRAEASKLITALADEPEHWGLYFLGVLLGGFRRGEMLGLEWVAVDQDKVGLLIEKQISLDENGQRIETDLKTEESHGFVAMPRWYMEELKTFRETWIRRKWDAQNAKKWLGGDKEYVFHNGKGIPYYPDAASKRWRRFLDQHDLPRIRLHDLRHTAAMLLREDGVDLKTIQERLRHSRLSTTADLYTHESETVSREAADRLESLKPSFPIRSQSQ